MFEAVLRGFARGQLEALSEEDRTVVESIIASIEEDPFHDEFTKGPTLVAPLVLSAYVGPRWKIVYRLVDERFVEIYQIQRSR